MKYFPKKSTDSTIRNYEFFAHLKLTSYSYLCRKIDPKSIRVREVGDQFAESSMNFEKFKKYIYIYIYFLYKVGEAKKRTRVRRPLILRRSVIHSGENTLKVPNIMFVVGNEKVFRSDHYGSPLPPPCPHHATSTRYKNLRYSTEGLE